MPQPIFILTEPRIAPVPPCGLSLHVSAHRGPFKDERPARWAERSCTCTACGRTVFVDSSD